MIPLTRLNGHPFVVNPDLLERAEATPDTVVTLVDGTRMVVLEPVEEIVERVVAFRASVAARAHQLVDVPLPVEHPAPRVVPAEGARVLSLPVREA